MLMRQVQLARGIAAFIDANPALELLPKGMRGEEVYIIVLFRAREDALNAALVGRINSARRIYVSGTQWEGAPAARFAVASWAVNVERDLGIVKELLEAVVR